MPHEEESYRYDFGTATYRRKPLYSAEQSVPDRAGMQRNGYRSATVRNPPDPVGWRSPSPYSANRDQTVLGFFEETIHRKDGNPAKWWNDALAIWQVPLTCHGNAGDLNFLDPSEVIQRALLKIGDMKSNLPVSIAERQKTVDLVTDSFRKLTRFLEDAATPSGRRRMARDWAREKGQRLRKKGKQVTDAYLAYRYGVVPTILDIEGLASAIEEVVIDKPVHLTGRASKKVPVNSSRTHPWQPGVNDIYTLITKGSGESGVRCRIDAVAYFQPFRTLQRTGLTNLPNVLWELVPYSFVADWVLGVGDWLQGMTALDGLEHVTVCVTSYSRVDSTTDVDSPKDRVIYTWDGWVDSYAVFTRPATLSQFTFARSVTSGAPSSKLLWKNPISLDHFADASALLIGALGIADKRESNPNRNRGRDRYR